MTKLTLTLIRGLPGSGKSTLAKQLIDSSDEQIAHLEADMFFVNKQGEYQFDHAQLQQAHQWCEQQCEQLLQQRQSVFISNTFVKKWEMKAYQQLAKKYHAELVITVCKGNYQSIHNVPIEIIKKMKRQWQD